jgi:hypothetical protein
MLFPFKHCEAVIAWLKGGTATKKYKFTRQNVLRACCSLLEFITQEYTYDIDPPYYHTKDTKDLAQLLELLASHYSKETAPDVDWIGIGASLKGIMKERLGKDLTG